MGNIIIAQANTLRPKIEQCKDHFAGEKEKEKEHSLVQKSTGIMAV